MRETSRTLNRAHQSAAAPCPPPRAVLPSDVKASLLAALVLVLAGGSAMAQEKGLEAPVHRVDGSFVREWLVLGPFPSPEIETDFLAEAGGEANVRPKEGDTVTRKDGRVLKWTRFRSEQDRVNLDEVFGIHPWSVAYAYCELRADPAGESDVRTLCGFSESALWLNGVKVRPFPDTLWAKFAYDPPPPLPIRLNTEDNPCLFKLMKGADSEDWVFSFQPLPRARADLEVVVIDPEGKKVAGAVVYVYDGRKLVGRAATDESGNASVCIFPSSGVCDLHLTAPGMEAWVFDLPVPPGERRSVTVPFKNDTVSLSGRVLAKDGSPQNAIVVQALRIGELPETAQPRSSGQGVDRDREETSGHRSSDALPIDGRANPRVRLDVAAEQPHLRIKYRSIESLLPMPPYSATTFTDTNGVFRFVNLPPGEYRLRCHGLHGYDYIGGGEDPEAGGTVVVEPGGTRAGIDFVLPEIKKGHWTTLPMATSASQVYRHIYRTPEGLLWIDILDYSLQAFDGREFKSFALTDEPNEVVRAMEYAADGTLWIGTASGINKVVKGHRESFPLDDSLPRNRINDILTDPDGTVWFATASGLCRYDGRDFATFSVQDGLPSNEVLSVMRSRDGTLWAGTGLGLASYDGGRFLEPKSFPYEDRVQSLLETRAGALWFADSHGDGAYCYDRGVLRHFGAQEGLLEGPTKPLDQVRDIVETSDGALWFATAAGISRFNGTNVVNYTQADGLTPGVINDLFVDADDVLWCAGDQGVSRFDLKSFTTFGKRDGLISSLGQGTAGVAALERDSADAFWMGTEWGGVWRSDRGRMKSLSTVGQFLELHRAAGGTIWAGGRDGIFRVQDGGLVRVLPYDWVNALTSDGQGNLWFGNGWENGGLLRFDPASRALSAFTAKDGLPINRVYAVEPAADGGLWVGTEIGLAHYRDEKIEDLREKLGIATGAVWEIRRDEEDRLWISTAQGLHILEPDNPLTLPSPPLGERVSEGRVRGNSTTANSSRNYGPSSPSLPGFRRLSLTATNGLPAEDIRCSVQTRDGIVWMGSLDRGLVGYDGKAFTTLDSRDSPIGGRILALLVEDDDSLWVGSDSRGLIHYQRSKTPPSVRLVKVKMDDVVSSDFANLPSPEIKTHVTVEYQEIDLKTHPDKRQFWYEVKGPSGATLYAGVTKDRHFEWAPRQGGAYTFEVRAIDRDLNYSPPARLTFRATVPWYVNAWITVPGGGTFGGLVIWAFVARAFYVRQRREADRLRERMLQQERQAREMLEERSRQLEEKSRQLEVAKDAADTANRAKSAFLANMSHEIRTPLNAILGYAQILRRKPGLPAEERAAVKTIEASGDHLLTLVNSVLDLSKIEAGSMEEQSAEFDLAQLMREVAAMFQIRCQEKGLEWRVEFECGVEATTEETEISGQRAAISGQGSGVGGLATGIGEESRAPNPKSKIQNPKSSLLVRGDGGKLRQVLINLLGNAVKFTDTGQVTLRVSKNWGGTGDSPVTVGDPPTGIAQVSKPALLARGDVLDTPPGGPPSGTGQWPVLPPHGFDTFVFSVIDTGPGIPVQSQGKLFAPFVQVGDGAKKGGTGLGLAISKRLVELMGGTIGLESAAGQGAKFHFTVPLAPASERALAHAPPEAREPSRLAEGFAVDALVVDDVEQNRQVLGQILSSLGCRVRLAESGPAALEQIRVQAPEIVFTDMRMPGMSGLELRGAILEEFGSSRMRIVAISASVLAHEQQHYLDSGFDDFIGKPFRVARLAACMARLLSVEFEYEPSSEIQSASGAITPDDLAPISLPASLLERLRTFAKAYRIVEFSRCLAEVEQLGAEGRRLAAALETLNQDGEKEKILEILGKLDG